MEYTAEQKIVLKIILGVLVLSLPVILLMVFFKPIAEKKNLTRYTKEYKLPQKFNAQDVQVLIANMKHDPEFVFYFYALTPDMVEEGVKKITSLLDQNR